MCISIEVNTHIQREWKRGNISKSPSRLSPARLCALIPRANKTLNSYCFALVSEEIESPHEAFTK